MSTFWLQDISELYRNYLDFIPNKDMDENELYNSITRLMIYIILLLIIFRWNSIIILIPITIIILVIMLWKVKGKVSKENYEEPNTQNKSIVIQSGVLDSNGDVLFNKATTNNTSDNNISDICVKPTISNPFMNPSIKDWTNEDDFIACDINDKEIASKSEKFFNANQFLNITDLFDRQNSLRQFYTIPSTTIPNKQTEFARWLYKPKSVCKINFEGCLRNDDIRFDK